MDLVITDDLGMKYVLSRWKIRRLNNPQYRMSRRQLRKAFEKLAKGKEFVRARYWFSTFYSSTAWVRTKGDCLRIGCCHFDAPDALTLQQWVEVYL